MLSTDKKFTDYVAYILYHEGKTSSNQKDKAAPCFPGGVHTNKGVTFCTFKSLAAKAGITPVDHDRFLKLTDADVSKFVYLFYKSIGGANLPDDLALIMTEAAWGSGPKIAQKHLTDTLAAFKVYPKTTAEKYAAIKNLPVVNIVETYFKNRWAWQIDWLGNTADYNWAKNGWTNRLNRYYKLFIEPLKKTASALAPVTPTTDNLKKLAPVVLIGFAALIFWLVKK